MRTKIALKKLKNIYMNIKDQARNTASGIKRAIGPSDTFIIIFGVLLIFAVIALFVLLICVISKLTT